MGRWNIRYIRMALEVFVDADDSVQLLSSKPAAKGVRESKNLITTVNIDEKEWEGSDEEQSEKEADAQGPKGDARKSAKKRGKKEIKQKQQAASKPASKNSFEALGTTDEGHDGAEDEEGDGKQKRLIENFCS